MFFPDIIFELEL